MSLYGNAANVQNGSHKKNTVEKGLREVEQEKTRPELKSEEKKKAAPANPKYINYQAISEKPKTSILPPENVKKLQEK